MASPPDTVAGAIVSYHGMQWRHVLLPLPGRQRHVVLPLLRRRWQRVPLALLRGATVSYHGLRWQCVLQLRRRGTAAATSAAGALLGGSKEEGEIWRAKRGGLKVAHLAGPVFQNKFDGKYVLERCFLEDESLI